jgi:hypothetical protein
MPVGFRVGFRVRPQFAAGRGLLGYGLGGERPDAKSPELNPKTQRCSHNGQTLPNPAGSTRGSCWVLGG